MWSLLCSHKNIRPSVYSSHFNKVGVHNIITLVSTSYIFNTILLSTVLVCACSSDVCRPAGCIYSLRFKIFEVLCFP